MRHDFTHFTDESLASYEHQMLAIKSQKGPVLYNLCFPIGLLGALLGIAGVVRGAIGEASPTEMRLTCWVLLVLVPAAWYLRRVEARNKRTQEEYLAVLEESRRRTMNKVSQ
jgi:hypothetical protein